MTKEKIYVIIYIKGSNIIYILYNIYTTYILYHRVIEYISYYIGVKPTLSSRYVNTSLEERKV